MTALNSVNWGTKDVTMAYINWEILYTISNLICYDLLAKLMIQVWQLQFFEQTALWQAIITRFLLNNAYFSTVPHQLIADSWCVTSHPRKESIFGVTVSWLSGANNFKWCGWPWVDHDSLQRTAVICVGKHVVLTNTAFPNQVESGYGYVLATILSLSQACHQTQLFQTNIKVCMYLQSD